MASYDVRPPKPYPTYPLFAHANGQWKKKIDGQQVSFGPWEWPDRARYDASWRAALQAYERRMEAIAKGVRYAEEPRMVLVRDCINHYLGREERRVPLGELSARVFTMKRTILKRFIDEIGREVTIGDIEDDQRKLDDYLAGLNDVYGVHAYNQHVKTLSGMFKAAAHPRLGLLRRSFLLQDLLKMKSTVQKRRSRRLREAEKGKQLWSPDELAAFWHYAERPLKTWIGLAFFAAFGQQDCADLPRNAVHFTLPESIEAPAGTAELVWARPKTEIDRAAMLPPRLVELLRAELAERQAPQDKADRHRFFLTSGGGFAGRGGLPIVRVNQHHDAAGHLERTVRIDTVKNAFEQFRGRLSKCPACGWLCKPLRRIGGKRLPGAVRKTIKPIDYRWGEAYDRCPHCNAETLPMRSFGFYTFRHTATTYAIPAASLEARCLLEGHAIAGARATYIQELDASELLKIMTRLEAKLDEGLRHIAAAVPVPEGPGREETSTAA